MKPFGGNPGFNKRQKELARKDKQREKSERKAQRHKEQREQRPGEVAAEDPDIAGIVPGPQPASDDPSTTG